MRTSSVICENIVECVPEVVKWNSWDAEHLKTIHSAYDDPQVLLTRNNDGLFIDKIKLPIVGIRIAVMVFTTQIDPNRQISFVKTPFFLGKNTIEVISLDKKLTKVKVTYQVSGNFIQSLLFPIILKAFKKWNKKIWLEDLPLKIRRQKALEYGFEDWIGLPRNVNDRFDKSLAYKTEIPVTKTKNIKESRHPFCEEVI